MSNVKISPYLYLPGNSEEALNFYKNVFNGKIERLQRFSDVPDISVSEEHKDKILHAHLTFGEQEIFFSDIIEHHVYGNQVSLALKFTQVEEIERVFQALSESGEVLMPLQDTFWGAKYGKLIDRYRVNWDLNCQL
ncbi:VOC family protein [Laceyella tengchongensis]|uniref:VOC family protein n=1 Tax=Laceyella tengchongensis TaxID=574699 RepID=UPI0012B8B4FE|nr:VOC family protein [Laceyella tengchongensis]